MTLRPGSLSYWVNCVTKIMILRVVGLGQATARRKNNQKLVNVRLLLYCQVKTNLPDNLDPSVVLLLLMLLHSPPCQVLVPYLTTSQPHSQITNLVTQRSCGSSLNLSFGIFHFFLDL